MVPKSTAGFHPIMKECACATRMRPPQRQPTATTRPPWRRPRASKPARPIPPRNPQVAVKLLYASPQPRRLARGGAATARALGRDTSNFSSEIGAPTVFAGRPPHTLVPGSLAPPGAGTQILLPHAPAANRACLLRLPPRLSACACPKVCSTCADVFFDPVVSEEGITYCRRCVPVAASNRTGEARPPPARAQRPAALVLSPAPRLRGPNRASAASAAPSPPPLPPSHPPACGRRWRTWPDRTWACGLPSWTCMCSAATAWCRSTQRTACPAPRLAGRSPPSAARPRRARQGRESHPVAGSPTNRGGPDVCGTPEPVGAIP